MSASDAILRAIAEKWVDALEADIARLTADLAAARRALEMATVVEWSGDTAYQVPLVRVNDTTLRLAYVSQRFVLDCLDAITEGLRAMLRWEGDARKFPPRPGEPAR